MIHTKITFTGYHVSSHWDIFSLKTESSLGWLVTSRGGTMEWIPWKRHRDIWVRWSLLWLFLVPIKLPTNTSMSVTNGVAADGWAECCCIFFSIIFSNAFWGRFFSKTIIFVMTSWAASVFEQTKGGLSHQPICSLLGNTISMSSIKYTGFIKEGWHNKSSRHPCH